MTSMWQGIWDKMLSMKRELSMGRVTDDKKLVKRLMLEKASVFQKERERVPVLA